VEGGVEAHDLDLIRREFEFRGDDSGVLGQAPAVAARVRVATLDRFRERERGLEGEARE
jgi:hypothetical protein